MSLHRLFVTGAFAMVAAVTATAQAHAKLESSDPQAGAVLTVPPKQVRLKFNEALEPSFSKIRLTDGKSNDIATPAAQVGKDDATVMNASLPALGSGTYRVQWTTMTRDGHKSKGEFTFQVK